MRIVSTALVPTIAALLFLAEPLSGQDEQQSAVAESRFAEANGVRLEYFEFGHSGVPVVFVQDHHDYFRLEQGEEWVTFLERFADSFRVLAPVRRGWGGSEDPGYGYDVATQAEDLLGLLDVLGIEQAILVGRTAATEEMTWLAEHHPERVLALAYLGTPFMQPKEANPEVQRFAQMYARGSSCDLGDADKLMQPRLAWRSHLIGNPNMRIEIRTLLVLHPVFDRVNMNVRRLDRIQEIASEDQCGDQEAKAYFTSLAEDTERLELLRGVFTEDDPPARIRQAMRTAFGENLTIVWEEDMESGAMDSWYVHLRPFLESVRRPMRESGGTLELMSITTTPDCGDRADSYSNLNSRGGRGCRGVKTAGSLAEDRLQHSPVAFARGAQCPYL